MRDAPNLQDGPFLAFHGDTDLQAKMLASVSAHVKADQVIQGFYGKGQGQHFRGCFIGCTIHAHQNGNTEDFDSNQGVFDAYGFPAELTRICEQIFEGLPRDKAPAFFAAVPNALNKGADLSLVQWEFLHWMVKDTLKKHGTADVRKSCSKSVAVLRDMAKGIKVTPRRARAAGGAAGAARAGAAAGAAGAAAAAYAAAYAAARAAARAARAAAAARAAGAGAGAAAAGAARAAAGAGAAYARYQEFADKLIELLKATPS